MPIPSSWFPNFDSPASVRRFLAVAAVGSVMLLIYASLVPLHFTPLSWEETRERWRHIPWLNLQYWDRADWVANALVVLPSGVLAAAAVDWGRPQRWPLLLAAPLISFFLVGVVIAIELVQVWFPPRTVSLNDIAAGCIGAVLGPVVWSVGGPQFESGIISFLRLPRFTDRLKWLCLGYVVFVLVYIVLPLDVALSYSEWQTRLAEETIRWNPFHGELAAQHAIKGLIFGAVRMGPVGVLMALVGRPRLALYGLIALPVALELLQLPLFGKYVTTMEIVGGWLGGGLGYLLGIKLDHFHLILHRPLLWGIAWCVAFAGTLAALLLRYDHVVRDPAEIARRIASAWDLPLVKYYESSEYNAYTNMVEKLLPFAILGVVAFGWQKTSSMPSRRVVFWLTLISVVVTACAIELLQVILPPLIPDISDVFTYLLGYIAGYQVTRLLWGTDLASPGATGSSQRRIRAGG